MSTFDYKAFAINMDEHAKNLVPNDLKMLNCIL